MATATATVQLLDRATERPAGTLLMADIRAYGRNYLRTKRWNERTEDQQARIECALKAFRTFRLNLGDTFLDDDPWAMAPPDMDTFRDYLGTLAVASIRWQQLSMVALRLYCLHHHQPLLFRMVELKQVRAILITR